MKKIRPSFWIMLLAILGTLCFGRSAMAFTSYLTAFQTQYPSSTTGTTAWSSTSVRCNVCHSAGGGTDLNAYGEAYAAAGHSFVNIQNLNSDGSSVDNIGEINSSAQPGWKPGATNTLYDVTQAGLGVVTASNQSPPSSLVGSADPASTTTTTTAPTTTTTAATTTTTAATTTTTAATTTTTPATTTTTPATTTTTAPTTTTTAPTTTTTRATTTTTAPTTTTTTKPSTTTTTKRTTTTTTSTTTTTLPSPGARLYETYCLDCHDGGAALGGGGRNVYGARTCSIIGAIYGTSVFPNGVPRMSSLQQVLSAADIQALDDYLNSFEGITGEHRYITACAGCHGIDARGGRVGEGVIGASAGNILEAIREEHPMGYLDCLPASDIKEIGQYLQSLKEGKRRGNGDDRMRDDRRRGR